MINKIASLALTAFVVLLFIWAFKKINEKYRIPVVGTAIEEV